MGECRVIIADPEDNHKRYIKSMLTQEGYLVVGEAEDGLTALKLIRNRQPDLVIIEASLAVMQSTEIATIVEEDRLAPVILFGTANQASNNKENPSYAYVIKPLNEYNLLPVIDWVLSNYKKIRALEEEIVKLKNTLESRKVVEKAKGILMETKRMTEKEAFRRIQKQSMNKRMSMKSVAKAIILAYEIDY